MKKFIFVTGPSESGKSGALNYISDNYGDKIKHLKIRNVFPEIYKDSGSKKEFQQWYDDEYRDNFESLWDRYIEKADQMSESKEVVIMDTMYGIKTIQYLYSKLGDNLGVLYIDANEKNRVMREYIRLRTDSPYSDRKADLSITVEDVIERTRKKDEKKKRLETFEYKDLHYDMDGGIGYKAPGKLFSYVIQNDGTQEEFYEKLDNFVTSICNKRVYEKK